MKAGNDAELLAALRTNLVPKGTMPVVGLFLRPMSYFNEEFVKECIDELQNACFNNLRLGEPITALQRLAMHVLTDSAGIEK